MSTRVLLGSPLSFEASKALRTFVTLESLDPVLEGVLAHILGTPVPADAGRSLQRALSLDSGTYSSLFTGVHWLVCTCMRSSLRPRDILPELLELKIQQEFAEAIVRIAQLGRESLAGPQSGDALPTLESLRWRLDVIISTNRLHRVLRPQLTLQCGLSDGNVHAFSRFNELRFTAAKCLKEMQDLEGRLPEMIK